MKLEICGVFTIEADDLGEIRALIAEHDSWRKANPEQSATNSCNRAQSARQNVPSYGAQPSTGNVDKWLAAHPDKLRFRITMEESALYGGNRELCAMHRLRNEGLEYEELMGATGETREPIETIDPNDEDNFIE